MRRIWKRNAWMVMEPLLLAVCVLFAFGSLSAQKFDWQPEAPPARMEKYRGRQNVDLAPQAMQESWVSGGFTADWTSSDFARMQKAWPKILDIIARYYHEGVQLTTGSDLPNSWVVPGVSLHQEMELLSGAGIPTRDVLAMATRNAAAALGLRRDIGTIEIGKRADLVILKANPLDDIRNTRRIEYVLSEGRIFRPSSLLTH